MITSHKTQNNYTIIDFGILSPKEISLTSHPKEASRCLRKGMVGWVVCGMKDVNDGLLSLYSSSSLMN